MVYMPLYRFFLRLGLTSCVLITFTIFTTETNAKDFFQIPVAPDFQAATVSNGSPRFISADAIEKMVRAESPNLQNFFHNQKIENFIVPKHLWFSELLDSFWVFLKKTGLRGEANTWDCENYSGMLNSLTTIKVWKAGFTDTRAAIGWLKVDAKKSWAGIPAEIHALMFAVTEKGFFIFEPQNGQYTNIAKYPNKGFIREVYLF